MYQIRSCKHHLNKFHKTTALYFVLFSVSTVTNSALSDATSKLVAREQQIPRHINHFYVKDFPPNTTFVDKRSSQADKDASILDSSKWIDAAKNQAISVNLPAEYRDAESISTAAPEQSRLAKLCQQTSTLLASVLPASLISNRRSVLCQFFQNNPSKTDLKSSDFIQKSTSKDVYAMPFSHNQISAHRSISETSALTANPIHIIFNSMNKSSLQMVNKLASKPTPLFILNPPLSTFDMRPSASMIDHVANQHLKPLNFVAYSKSFNSENNTKFIEPIKSLNFSKPVDKPPLINGGWRILKNTDKIANESINAAQKTKTNISYRTFLNNSSYTIPTTSKPTTTFVNHSQKTSKTIPISIVKSNLKNTNITLLALEGIKNFIKHKDISSNNNKTRPIDYSSNIRIIEVNAQPLPHSDYLTSYASKKISFLDQVARDNKEESLVSSINNLTRFAFDEQLRKTFKAINKLGNLTKVLPIQETTVRSDNNSVETTADSLILGEKYKDVEKTKKDDSQTKPFISKLIITPIITPSTPSIVSYTEIEPKKNKRIDLHDEKYYYSPQQVTKPTVSFWHTPGKTTKNQISSRSYHSFQSDPPTKTRQPQWMREWKEAKYSTNQNSFQKSIYKGSTEQFLPHYSRPTQPLAYDLQPYKLLHTTSKHPRSSTVRKDWASRKFSRDYHGKDLFYTSSDLHPSVTINTYKTQPKSKLDSLTTLKLFLFSQSPQDEMARSTPSLNIDSMKSNWIPNQPTFLHSSTPISTNTVNSESSSFVNNTPSTSLASNQSTILEASTLQMNPTISYFYDTIVTPAPTQPISLNDSIDTKATDSVSKFTTHSADFSDSFSNHQFITQALPQTASTGDHFSIQTISQWPEKYQSMIEKAVDNQLVSRTTESFETTKRNGETYVSRTKPFESSLLHETTTPKTTEIPIMLTMPPNYSVLSSNHKIDYKIIEPKEEPSTSLSSTTELKVSPTGRPFFLEPSTSIDTTSKILSNDSSNLDVRKNDQDNLFRENEYTQINNFTSPSYSTEEHNKYILANNKYKVLNDKISLKSPQKSSSFILNDEEYDTDTNNSDRLEAPYDHKVDSSDFGSSKNSSLSFETIKSTGRKAAALLAAIRQQIPAPLVRPWDAATDYSKNGKLNALDLTDDPENAGGSLFERARKAFRDGISRQKLVRSDELEMRLNRSRRNENFFERRDDSNDQSNNTYQILKPVIMNSNMDETLSNYRQIIHKKDIFKNISNISINPIEDKDFVSISLGRETDDKSVIDSATPNKDHQTTNEEYSSSPSYFHFENYSTTSGIRPSKGSSEIPSGRSSPITVENIDSTQFNCHGKTSGFHPDIKTRCRTYYHCSETGHLLKFSCTNQSRFDVKTWKCSPWYEVACGLTYNEHS